MFLKVTIVFKSSLQRYTTNENDEVSLDIKENTSVKDILRKLNLLTGEVGLVILNSKIARMDDILKDEDYLELYPVVGGG
ncbi:MoaD/ThiS family protein [Thermoanaerobacteraceae bacterium SP2]|nr:MoaD/ThiS family protein [Thermoanaerobacteraceae bacterium SP2]